jgi:benzoyl-CoA reductase/2-hydroxyglutaryl-CoA dehydratase subunit BcrC/BadD/HgdB
VDDTPEGKAFYGRYFRTLIGQVEDLTGERLDEERLRRVVERGNRCTELYWELFEYRKMKPSPLPNLFNLFLAPLRFCLWGTDAGIRTLEAMLETGERRRAAGLYTAEQEQCRVLWAYTSYYFNVSELHRWMGQKGWSFLADVLSLYLPQPIDTQSWDTMVDGLVTAAWEYPMNRQMGTSSMSRAWVSDMVWAAKELGADCVVHCGHDACKQTWSVVSILGEELKKQADVPLLVLHGDSWLKTTTPITVIQQEMEEFIGNVVLGSKRSRRKVRRKRPAAKAAGQ